MPRILLLLLSLCVSGLVQAALTNQLKNHPSPYLAMHGDDPVHWQRWSRDVLARAKRENKLIYISSGYFACHWCHVMQRESYKNPQVAALLNEYFIPVKVDRELQPALDAHLIDFVQRTRGHAGWPLNVFLTPEGYPLIGLTYSPRDGFIRLLRKLQRLWADESTELSATARRAAAAVGQDAVSRQPPASMDWAGLEQGLIGAAMALGDDMEGGFGRQSRFPMAPQWSVLLQRLERKSQPQLAALTDLTLKQMARQGMRDHIGGGFFRYTVDPSWQTPHYEKMLYTQALLSRLYLQAAEVLGQPAYREVARDTLDFTLRELKGEAGGFIASLSAVDPVGVEGGGYLWTKAQLEAALDEQELAFARKRWRLQGAQAQEGGYLPVDETSLLTMAKTTGGSLEQLQQLERQVKRKLLQARAPRNHPRDVKQLAAWNGLMLSALVDGARSFGDVRYRKAAAGVRDFLLQRLWDGRQLHRAWGDDGPLGSAALEDYAYVAAGLRDWAAFTGSADDMALARRLVTDAWERFFTGDGWHGTDDLMLPGIATEAVIPDGPLPSPAALLIDLGWTLEIPAIRQQIRQALEISYQKARQGPIWYATHVQALLDARAWLLFPAQGVER